MKTKLLDLKNRILKNKIYLILLIIYFVIAFIVTGSFENKNRICKYEYNTLMQGGRSPYIEKDVEVSQRFISREDNLCKIGIKALMPEISTNSNVNVRVIEIDSGKEIFNQNVFLGSLKDGDFMEITIENQFNSKNKEYEIIVKGIDGDKYNSIQFPHSTEKSEYLMGCTEENELKETNFILKTTHDLVKANKLQFLCWSLVFLVATIFVLYGTDGKIDEKTFLKLALTFGLFFIIFTPIFHALDECNHYFRALMISQGNFIDEIDETNTIGGTIPDNLSKYFAPYTWDQGVRLKNIFLDKSVFFEKYSSTKSFVKNIYFSSTLPTGHVIPAIGIFLARILGMSIYASIISGRLMVYIFYCAFGYLTLKNLKYYKSIFFAILTVPVSFWLAGTIHLDPILNVSCLLFVAICLKYMLDKNNEEDYISKFDLLMLVVSAIFIITCKYLVGIPILLMFFFIPKNKFKSLKSYIAFIIFAIILGISLIGWQFWMLDKYPYVEDRNGHVDQLEQVEFIKNNLPQTIKVFLNNMQITACIWIDNFSLFSILSGVSSSTGFILILVAILEKNKSESLQKNKVFNIISTLLFFAILGLGLLALYLSFTPVGKNSIDGYQLRYLISPMILLLVPFANIFNVNNNIKDYDKKLLFVILLTNIDLILAEIGRNFINFEK